MIAIIDYNAGNLRSIKKAVELYSNNIVITNDSETIFSADKIILPGVGNFGSVMQNLSVKNGEYSLKEVICKVVEDVPFLGICLGMQLLMEQSEECGAPQESGLGIIKGDVLKFKGVEKIPHMGWNNVEQVKDILLFDGIKNNEYFYFVHSYYVNPSNTDVIAGVSDYGNKFTCVLNKDNIYATQFHPEKSGNAGLKMIENFVELI